MRFTKSFSKSQELVMFSDSLSQLTTSVAVLNHMFLLSTLCKLSCLPIANYTNAIIIIVIYIFRLCIFFMHIFLSQICRGYSFSRLMSNFSTASSTTHMQATVIFFFVMSLKKFPLHSHADLRNGFFFTIISCITKFQCLLFVEVDI